MRRAASVARMATAVCFAALVGACYQEPVALRTYPPTEPPTTTLRPPPPTTPAPPITTPDLGATPGPSLHASADCVNGWTTPALGSAQYDAAIAVVQSQMEVAGPWSVEDLRFFTGPDVPLADPPAALVERWYLRAGLADDAEFRARWLVERRSPTDQRVVAIAPYDTHGFASPDWTAFAGDGPPTNYLGLPGRWVGTPYDFVTGAGYSGESGLPAEVIGCLAES